MPLPALSLFIFFISCSSYISLLLFAKIDFAVFPDAFPCIIYDKKENQKEKKKHLAYFSL